MKLPTIKLGITLAGALALVVLPAHVSANAIAYTVTILGEGNAFGINNSGQVAGQGYPAGSDPHAVRWTGTIAEDLGTLGGNGSIGLGINASGQIAGRSRIGGNTEQHAVRWTGTTPTDLGTLGGDFSEGNGINASGQIAGRAHFAGADHAVRWTGTTPEVLGNLGGGSSSWGIAINDSGQVAGWSAKVFGGQEQAVRWTGTTPTDLGTLGGTFSSGWAINDSGQVAGYAATTNNSAIHAVRWTGTTPTDLGTLGGFNSQGFGINAFGDVIGMSMIAGDPFNGAANYAFLYTGGTMYHLLDLLVPGSGVTNLRIGGYSNGINDLGQIAAFSTINGRTYALRLDPVVPEPATAALLLVGGALLALRRRSFV